MDKKNNDLKSTRKENKIGAGIRYGGGAAGRRTDEDPGGPWAQYMYGLALTCQLNWQFGSGIDRDVAAISCPD